MIPGDLFAGDIVNQAKDSGAKFIISSQKCAAKAVDVKEKLSQQIKVMCQFMSPSRTADRINRKK